MLILNQFPTFLDHTMDLPDLQIYRVLTAKSMCYIWIEWVCTGIVKHMMQKKENRFKILPWYVDDWIIIGQSNMQLQLLWLLHIHPW